MHMKRDSDLSQDAKRETAEGGGVPRRRRNKAMVAGVIVVVAAVAGIAGWIWHEQPSFCGTVCHNVMGSYVEGYESGDPSLLVSQHAQLNDTCLDCHEPTIGEQMSELGAYVAGAYRIPLEESGIGTREFCMRAGCHDDWDAVVEATSNWKGTETVYNPAGIYNPHDNHRGDSDCGSCHQVHGQSKLYCVECHNMDVPEGWIGFE